MLPGPQLIYNVRQRSLQTEYKLIKKKKVLSRPFFPTLPLLIASTIDGLARIISFPRLTLRSGYWRGRSLVRRPRRAFTSFFLKRPPLLDLAPDDLREVTSPATPGSRASAH